MEQEYALTAVDFLARRTRLAYLDYSGAMEALPLVGFAYFRSSV